MGNRYAVSQRSATFHGESLEGVGGCMAEIERASDAVFKRIIRHNPLLYADTALKNPFELRQADLLQIDFQCLCNGLG